MEQEQTGNVPGWFKEVFEPIGSEFVANPQTGEVAASTPWGAGYIPKRYDEMDSAQREQADGMIERWEGDDNFVKTKSANGLDVYTDKTSGFSASTGHMMLTANAEGKYEVASMFDIGMYTGAVAEGKAQRDIDKAMLGDTAEEAGKSDAQAMLETDQADDTSMIGEPGAPTAGPTVEGAMPPKEEKPNPTDPITMYDDKGAETTLDPKEYDVAGLRELGPQMKSSADAFLAKNGIKPDSPDYQANFNKAMSHLINQQKDNYKFAVEPKAGDFGTTTGGGADQPEGKTKNMEKDVHWMDRGEYQQFKADNPENVYERNYTNEAGSNNYGNYTSEDDYYGTVDETLTALDSVGSKTSKAKAAEFRQNREKYHNLGIATLADKDAYEADMDVEKAKRKSSNTAAGRKMEAEARDANTLREAYDSLDTILDKDPEASALDNVKLSRKQARLAKMAQKDDLPKHYRESIDAIEGKVKRTKRIKDLFKLGDAANLEKVKPADRATQWLSKYFGADKKEMNTQLAKMGMEELVSRTIKEISGAAASDQERAYIREWMLGGEGLDSNVVKSILNNIEYNAYSDAKDVGEKLYTDGRISALQSLSNNTKHLHGMKLEDVVIPDDFQASAPKKIKRVPGSKR